MCCNVVLCYVLCGSEANIPDIPEGRERLFIHLQIILQVKICRIKLNQNAKHFYYILYLICIHTAILSYIAKVIYGDGCGYI